MKEAYAAEPSTLFVIGSYHIGKERAFFSAAQALGFRIWCDPGKKKVGSCPLPQKAQLPHAAACMTEAVCQVFLQASLLGPRHKSKPRAVCQGMTALSAYTASIHLHVQWNTTWGCRHESTRTVLLQHWVQH